MSAYSLSNLSDPALLRDLAALVARDRATTAALLAHLAEVDSRKLYLPAAYPSMFAYCVGALHFSEDMAYKRIQAARAGRRFPEIFRAVADGRLQLTAAVLIAPHLTPCNLAELLAEASWKTRAEIEALLARRFPRPDLVPMVRAVPAPATPSVSASELVLEPVRPSGLDLAQLVSEPVAEPEPGEPEPRPDLVASVPPPAHAPAAPSRCAPIAPARYAIQFTVGQETHDLLRRAQALLGREVSGAGGVAEVLHRALETLVTRLEHLRWGERAPRGRGYAGGSHSHAAHDDHPEPQ